MMDRRPRKADGTLYQECIECPIKPQDCKGFCIFQKMEANSDISKSENKQGGEIVD